MFLFAVQKLPSEKNIKTWFFQSGLSFFNDWLHFPTTIPFFQTQFYKFDLYKFKWGVKMNLAQWHKHIMNPLIWVHKLIWWQQAIFFILFLAKIVLSIITIRLVYRWAHKKYALIYRWISYRKYPKQKAE